MPNRMFQSVTRTWNPVIGCEHDWTYCWARDLALGRFSKKWKYRKGFSPNLHFDDLGESFKPGEFIFVSSMGDLFGEWVPREWIHRVLHVVGANYATDFLFQTKNPARFLEFEVPPTVYAGVTIESDIDHGVSKAPSPYSRYLSILKLPFGTRTFLSIEPISDFTPSLFYLWIEAISPDIIEIGADNHNNHLPEPSSSKVTGLISRLRSAGFNVKEKPGLERITGEIRIV